jgi:hypothetical protein
MDTTDVPLLVTDPVMRSAPAERLAHDIALVTSYLMADVWLMSTGAGRTKPAPVTSVLRAAGIEAIVTKRGKHLADPDLPSIQRIVRWALFELDWTRNYRRLTEHESLVQAAACRLSDAVEPIMDLLEATNTEAQA